MTDLVLPSEFYHRDVTEVAPNLIGKLLCRRDRAGLTIGRIVETEAYLAKGDSAAHSFKGINRRNASMFGPAGHAYVYTIHARQCFNVVTEARGTGSAVLIRAVEPLVGVDLMERRRGTKKFTDLCRGPARLCEAFNIPRSLDGRSLLSARRLWIAGDQRLASANVSTSVRIGVTSAHHRKLRFFCNGNVYVSGPRLLNRG